MEAALEDEAASGRDYLDKIVQVTFEVPPVPDQLFLTQLTAALSNALDDIQNQGPFDQQAWPDILLEIVRPLVSTPRDLSRLAAMTHGAVAALEGQVAVIDVIPLEAVRIFVPEMFELLHQSIEALTSTDDTLPGGTADGSRPQIDRLIAAAGDANQAVAQSLVRRLFPAAERHIGGASYGPDWENGWITNRRVAHREVLRLYLERTLDRGMLAHLEAERAWQSMADQEALQSILESLHDNLRIEVVSALEAFEDQFAPEHVVPAVTALLNFVPQLPSRGRGLFDLDPNGVVRRVTFRLLRSLQDKATVEDSVRKILPRLNSLSAKMQLILQVGHDQSSGHELVSEGAAKQFERDWVEEVKSASTDDLLGEHELLRVILRARYVWNTQDASIEVEDRPDLTYALLQSARSESTSQTIGSRAVQVEPQLAWDALVRIYGEESTLVERLQKLLVAPPDNSDATLLELATKYATGWRPGR